MYWFFYWTCFLYHKYEIKILWSPVCFSCFLLSFFKTAILAGIMPIPVFIICKFFHTSIIFDNKTYSVHCYNNPQNLNSYHNTWKTRFKSSIQFQNQRPKLGCRISSLKSPLYIEIIILVITIIFPPVLETAVESELSFKPPTITP